jgi:hypothetical protein
MWNYNTPLPGVVGAQTWLHHYVDKFRTLSPDTGAYVVSEGSFFLKLSLNSFERAKQIPMKLILSVRYLICLFTQFVHILGAYRFLLG